MSFVFLYLEFFQIGLFAVGGGLATLPFLFLMGNYGGTFIRETGWLSTAQVGNFLAIAQCAPGAVGVNVAAQTGFLYGSVTGGVHAGILGGAAAVLGLVSPAIIIIAIVARALQSIKTNKTAVAVFSGLRPAATGLLSAAGWGILRLALYNSDAANAGLAWHEIFRWREGLISIALFFLIIKGKLHPILYVALGAVAGIVLKLGN